MLDKTNIPISHETKKRALRKQLMQQRMTLTAEQQHLYTQNIINNLCAFLRNVKQHTIAFYLPFRNEPDITASIIWWLSLNNHHRAVLPIVEKPHSPLIFRQWTQASTLTPNTFGTLEPLDGQMMTPQLLLIPLIGFDTQGYRLGYGGGYYDRTISSLPEVQSVGIGYELSRVASVFPQSHDQAMNWIITEQETFNALTR